MKIVLSLGAVVLIAAGYAFAAGTAGTVDPDFGTGGVVVLSGVGANSDSIVFDVEAQADGKLVAAGYAASGVVIDGRETVEWSIRRLLADGTLDLGFGAAGEAHFYADPGHGGTSARALHVDGAGRIWVAGKAIVATGTTGKGKKIRTTYAGGGIVLRLTATGLLDTTFGDQGEARLFDDVSQVQALVPLSGGHVLLVGRGPVTTASSGGGKGRKNKGGSATSQGIVIACLDSGGAVDTSYGTSGFARFDIDPTSDDDYPTLHGAALQSDGSLVVMTTLSERTGDPHVGLVRFTATGERDASFADPAPDIYLRTLAVDAQDRLLVGGYDAGDLYVLRYDPDGLLDAGFGSGGEAQIAASASALQTEPIGGRGIHLDGSNVVMACFERTDPDDPVDDLHTFAVRLLDDGSLDTSYGPALDGFSERLLAAPAVDAVLLSDADLVTAGQSYATGSLGDWTVGRLLGR